LRNTKTLWAVELNISYEAGKPDYWVIYSEADDLGLYSLCVYETKKEAVEAAKGRDHASRVVKFTRCTNPTPVGRRGIRLCHET
jgi:hypothetical protein